MDRGQVSTRLLTVIFALLILSSCGEGGIDGTGIYLQGTAVDGAPLKGTKILVTGQAGRSVETTTGDVGNFRIKVNELSAPYLLKAETADNDELYSIALKEGTINIHSLTDVVSRKYFVGENQDIDAGFNPDGNTDILIDETQAKIDEISASFDNLLETAYGDFFVPENFNFFVSEFDADDKLFDALLDQLRVVIEDGEISIVLIDQGTNITANIIVNLNIATDLNQDDDRVPTEPAQVRPAAASNAVIIVGWVSSTDNIGVAGYRVYRSNPASPADPTVLQDTVAVPVYVDANVEASKEYCYEIEAFDVRGNTSSRSGPDCTTTRSEIDLEPPSSIDKITINASSVSSIDLAWLPGLETDILGYHVYREMDQTFKKIATVVASAYKNEGLLENTEYCYRIDVFDAALNRSAQSEIFCATTPLTTDKANGPADDAPPITKASLETGEIGSGEKVALICDDKGGSGCKQTYFTLNGDMPTIASPVYEIPFVIESDRTLKYFSVDVAGNSEPVTTVEYSVVIPVAPISPVVPIVSVEDPQMVRLSIVSNDADGKVVSDVGGIDCGSVCSVDFPIDAQVVLTALHPNNLATSWVGCTEATNNQCTVSLSADIQVTIDFVPTVETDSAAPVTKALPIGGDFDAATTVRLICSDNGGSGCRSSFYTLDGSTPTTGSSSYSTALDIRESLRLNYFSIDNDGNKEPVRSEIYTIALPFDDLPATTTATPTGGSYDTAQVITLVCNDDGLAGCDKIFYTLDGIEPSTDSLLYTAALTFDKSVSIMFFSVDKRGNKENFRTEVYNIDIPVDTSPPVTEAQPKAGAYDVAFNVSLNCRDTVGAACEKTYFTTDGSEPTSVSNTFSASIRIGKNTTLKFFSIDNAGNKESIKTVFYTINLPNDTGPIITTATPKGGYYGATVKVSLGCDDIDGVGCGTTYFTRDGSEPTVNSEVYAAEISINEDTLLKYFTIDDAGNPEPVRSTVYYITVAPLFSLRVASNDVFGNIKSDVAGIDCGSNCAAKFPLNTLITLSTTHPVNPRLIWNGCNVISNTQCSLKISADTLVNVEFVPYFSEKEPNNSFDEADFITGLNSIDAYFNTADDEDYYKFEISEAGLMYAYISHDRVSSYLYLYNINKQIIRSSGFKVDHTLSISIQPGTYFLRIVSRDAEFDTEKPYRLEFSGSALGGTSPDIYESNDTVASANQVFAAGLYEGYFDTQDDFDYFYFIVPIDSFGTFQAKLSHSSVSSNLYLYNSSETVISSSIRGTRHAISRTLKAGTYYVVVTSYATEFDQLNPYSLELSGTVLNDDSPDIFEDNDSPQTAFTIDARSEVQGYFDTGNDLDYFEIIVKNTGTLYIENFHDSVQSRLILQTGNGFSGQSLNPIIAQSVVPGTYSLLVSSLGGFDLNTPYTLKFSGSVFDDPIIDINEPNDLVEKAIEIPGAGEYSGYFDTTNDVDYFGFNVETAGTFLAMLSHESINGSMFLADEQNTQILFATAPTILTRTLQPGNYTIYVTSSGTSLFDLSTPYKLTLSGSAISDEALGLNEPDDTIEQATIVETESIFESYLETTNDIDYYQIDVSTSGTFYAKYSHDTLRGQLTLRNEKQEDVVVAGLREVTLAQSLTPGIYYISVEGYRADNIGREVPYMLELSGTVLGGTSPDIFEENDSFDTAKTIDAIGTYEGYLDTINDQDFYRFVVDSAGKFSAVINYFRFRGIFLHDKEFNIIGATLQGNNVLTDVSLSPGTYYIQAYSTGFYSLDKPYSLILSFK